jgi:hypothetical protein
VLLDFQVIISKHGINLQNIQGGGKGNTDENVNLRDNVRIW